MKLSRPRLQPWMPPVILLAISGVVFTPFKWLISLLIFGAVGAVLVAMEKR